MAKHRRPEPYDLPANRLTVPRHARPDEWGVPWQLLTRLQADFWHRRTERLGELPPREQPDRREQAQADQGHVQQG